MPKWTQIYSNRKKNLFFNIQREKTKNTLDFLFKYFDYTAIH